MGKSSLTPSSLLTAFYAFGLLAFGACNVLSMKGQFLMTSVGINGTSEQFSKPWFATFIIFFACTLVFCQDIALWCLSCCSKGKVRYGTSPSLTFTDDSPKADRLADPLICVEEQRYWSKVPLVAIPAVIDVLASSFGCIGLVFVPASVFQMLKGSMIIFAAIFAVACLRRRLMRFHWLGVAICVAGVAVVGMAAFLGSHASSQGHSPADVGLGMALVLIGQVLQAAQMVLEEWLLKTIGLSGPHVIGWEGAWGCVVMLAIVFPLVSFLPGADHGHMEDLQDTLVLLKNNSALCGLVALYTVSCAFYNIFGISVTGALTTVHRTMLEASRSLIIWLVALLVHYYVDSESQFGEAWTCYSYIQLAGFLLLILGQAIYGEIAQVPFMSYPPAAELEADRYKSPLAEQWLSPNLPKREASVDSKGLIGNGR